jgi:LacI family transcriptional regulator
MKDVAKEAGVSVATVSNTISGKKYVSPELKKHVLETIEKMGYKPSRLAQSLKINRTKFIGLMIPDITNPYFAEIARGVEGVCIRNDLQFFLCNTDGSVKQEHKILNTFMAQHVEGIINVAPRMAESEFLEYLHDIPMVILDRKINLDHPMLDNIYMCNEKGAVQVAQYFLEKKFENFACISGPEDVLPARKRLKGFCSKLLASGVNERNVMVKFGDFKYDSGYALAKEIIRESKKPLALFASNDLMAWGAVEAIKELDFRIPEDISIVGYDNIFIAKLIVPSLTTVNQKKYEAGRTAMEALFNKIKRVLDDEEQVNHIVELQTELIIRQT